MMGGAVEQFRDAIRAAGLTPPDSIEDDGKLHRFASNGKRNDDAGWYVLHLDGVPAGCFGDWRTGLKQSWRAEMGRELTPAEEAEYRRKVESAHRQREASEMRKHAEAARRAARIWDAARPAPANHPYLTLKGAPADGLRLHKGLLVIPLRDAAGVLHSLQFIDAEGGKRYLGGGKVSGCYFVIGMMAGVLYIAEGYATAATIHAATGHAVAVAFDAGNLKSVARVLREKHPDIQIVVCADDDRATSGNPGMTKASDAARGVGGLVAIPNFGADIPVGASDFNDLAKYRGHDAVISSVATAKTPEPLDDAWPELRPLTVAVDQCPYPLDALQSGIREAVAEVVDFVQCPAALAANSALSALSLAAQALANVRRANGLEGPISLFMLAIADSGERKTSCDNYFLKSIREWESEQAERAKPDVARHAAKVAAWEECRAGIRARIREAARRSKDTSDSKRDLERVEGECPPPLRIPSLIYADTTPEALAYALHRRWPSAGVMSNEAGIVFGGHGMQRDSVMRTSSLMNAMWDGSPHAVQRRTSESFRLAGARLTMGLATQSETVKQFLEGTKGLPRSNGFTARFLIAAPASTQGSRPFKEVAAWRHLPAFSTRLRALLAFPVPMTECGALTPQVLLMTDEARALWIHFHDDVERELRQGGELAEVRDVGSKAADNMARLAALFHLFEHGPSGQVGADAVASAAAVVGWHLYQARAFLGDVAAPPTLTNAQRLECWLIDHCKGEGNGAVERRTIQNRGPNPVRGGADLDAALSELIAAGRVREIAHGTRRLVEVNPALLGGGNGVA